MSALFLRNTFLPVTLIQLGTFLEYFDLMLYIHMASLLNQLFFLESNEISSQALMALAFCSTFLFRPFGALIFGYIGDNLGRKVVIVITMMIMAFSSIVMASIPTYAQIGVMASIVVTLCRILQGISSVGEKIGADIYLIETSEPPLRYFLVSLSGVFAALGTSVAILSVYLVNLYDLNFRWLFWLGGLTAVVALLIRVGAKESPVFLQLKNITSPLSKTKSSAIWAYFAIDFVWPIIFYLVYVYFSILLKNNFEYSLQDITWHNFILSLIELGSLIVMSFMTFKIHPLKILQIKFWCFFLFALLCPFIIPMLDSPLKIMLMQTYILIFAPTAFPASAIFFMHFAVQKRFTFVAWINALSRALVYPLTAFGLIYLIDSYGYFGLSYLLLIACSFFWLGLRYFKDKIIT